MDKGVTTPIIHTLLHAKKCIQNPECRCGPECTNNYHTVICKYSLQFRNCNNVKCYRIYLKETMRKRSPQEQHQALSQEHRNQFHNPSRPAHSTFANKPFKTTRSFNTHNSAHTPIKYYSYSHNQISPYSNSFTSCSSHPHSQQLSSPKHNLRRQHTTVESPSHLPQYYHQNNQPISKIEQNTYGQFPFLFEKIMNLQHQLDNTAGANGSARKRKQVYWGKQISIIDYSPNPRMATNNKN